MERATEATSDAAAKLARARDMVDRRSSPATRRRFDQLLTTLDIEVVDVTVDQARVAREAHRDFGKGTGSRARLNPGDCFSCALAVAHGEELLFTGDDFGATDVAVAAY